VSTWQRSSRCGESTHCVEVWFEPSREKLTVDEPRFVLVRSSSDPTGPTLRFTETEWRSFLAVVSDGNHDL
jgi:hypothetical protein